MNNQPEIRFRQMKATIRISRAFYFAVLLASAAACKKEANFPVDKIGVKWELITNFTDSADVFNAKFTLTNNSDKALLSDWNMFFNMAPRPILRNREPQAATMHHIN